MAVHGTAGVIELKGRSGWRQTGGAFQERVWEVPTGRLAFFQSQTLPTGYTDISYEQDEDLTIVRAVFSAATADQIGNPADDGLIERHWELDGDDLETSLWAHPKIVAATAGDTTLESAQLRSLIEKILSGEVTEIPGTTDIDELVKRLAKGIEVFQESKFVLRKVETVRKGTSIRPSFANLNRSFGYTALLAAEPSLASENIIQASGLTALKWLKGAPQVAPTQDGLWQINQEYKGADQWDTWIYPAAS